MKNVYPVCLTNTSDGLVVYIPDFDIGTQGQTVVEAIEMARDAIGLTGITMEDEKRPLPVPSILSEIRGAYPDDLVTLVDVDFSEYRRKNDLRTVKKNCTLPSWLCYAAEQAGLNFSQVLQNALKQELYLND